MYLRTLKLWNFRKYGIKGDTFANASPGIEINFHPHINVLIGENDSGKTTVIDAIKYALRTQSGEFIQIEEKDFYFDNTTQSRATELKVECTFADLSEQEKGLFLEWLSLEENNDEKQMILNVWLYAKRQDNEIYPRFYAGVGDNGSTMEAEARNMLRAVYLKPLRDALTDMTHGYKSRLAQILGAHNIFKTTNNDAGQPQKHELENKYSELKAGIEKYFQEEQNGGIITNKINNLLQNFLFDESRKAQIQLTGGELTEILRQLDLVLETNKSGLGTLNLLCIAAEMLMFEQQKRGLKLALVEELEAHLHPQYQLRVIDNIRQQAAGTNAQFILSTHSITLASKLNLEDMIIFKDNDVFPMGKQFTELSASDYSFLERFLDATKANLFFARGLIIVEGDAENLLIPAIAQAIGRPLNNYGVSIVNVGNTAYKRYVKIFQRTDNKNFNIPISIVSDLDIPSIEYFDEKEHLKKKRVKEIISIADSSATDDVETLLEKLQNNDTTARNQFEQAIQKARETKANSIEEEYSNDQINIFIPKCWTLEYEIARSALYQELETAIQLAKKDTKGQIANLSQEYETISKTVFTEYANNSMSESERAYKIFKPLCDGDVSKAATAQYLAEIFSHKVITTDKDTQKRITDALESDPYLSYLVEAINHATMKGTK